MQKLRILAATLASALCALGLSVGAAMAEGPHEAATTVKAAQSTPKGLCFLHDAPAD